MRHRGLVVVGWLLSCTLCFGCGLAYGLLRGTGEAYGRRYDEERDRVVPVLSADPAFARVALGPRSDGGISLSGEVPSQADLDRLRAQVARQVGEPRAREPRP